MLFNQIVLITLIWLCSPFSYISASEILTSSQVIDTQHLETSSKMLTPFATSVRDGGVQTSDISFNVNFFSAELTRLIRNLTKINEDIAECTIEFGLPLHTVLQNVENALFSQAWGIPVDVLWHENQVQPLCLFESQYIFLNEIARTWCSFLNDLDKTVSDLQQKISRVTTLINPTRLLHDQMLLLAKIICLKDLIFFLKKAAAEVSLGYPYNEAYRAAIEKREFFYNPNLFLEYQEKNKKRKITNLGKQNLWASENDTKHY